MPTNIVQEIGISLFGAWLIDKLKTTPPSTEAASAALVAADAAGRPADPFQAAGLPADAVLVRTLMEGTTHTVQSWMSPTCGPFVVTLMHEGGDTVVTVKRDLVAADPQYDWEWEGGYAERARCLPCWGGRADAVDGTPIGVIPADQMTILPYDPDTPYLFGGPA